MPALAGLWRIVEPALERILTGLPQHAGGVAALAAKIGGRQRPLRQAQAWHWQSLFCGRFDAACFDSTCQMVGWSCRFGVI
jgi:hypothetical protein